MLANIMAWRLLVIERINGAKERIREEIRSSVFLLNNPPKTFGHKRLVMVYVTLYIITVIDKTDTE